MPLVATDCNCEPPDQLSRNTVFSDGDGCTNDVWQQQAHDSTRSEKPGSPLARDQPQTDGGCDHRTDPPKLTLMQICNRDARRLGRQSQRRSQTDACKSRHSPQRTVPCVDGLSG